jgi:hypothetical protein
MPASKIRMRLMVTSLPVSREEILVELTPNKMDPEAGIRMPEDRGPDSLVGRAHWADVSQSDLTLRKNNTDFARLYDLDLSIQARPTAISHEMAVRRMLRVIALSSLKN